MNQEAAKCLALDTIAVGPCACKRMANPDVRIIGDVVPKVFVDYKDENVRKLTCDTECNVCQHRQRYHTYVYSDEIWQTLEVSP